MELLKTENFRVKEITRLTGIEGGDHRLITETLPWSCGLGVEKKYIHEGKDCYIVVCFIKPDKDGLPEMDTVGLRVIEEVDSGTWDEFKACCLNAEDALKYAQEHELAAE